MALGEVEVAELGGGLVQARVGRYPVVSISMSVSFGEVGRY